MILKKTLISLNDKQFTSIDIDHLLNTFNSLVVVTLSNSAYARNLEPQITMVLNSSHMQSCQELELEEDRPLKYHD